MLTIKIKVRSIESARQIIESHKFINHDYRIKVEDGFGYIPIKEDIAQEELDSVINEVKDAHDDDFFIELVENSSEFDSIKIYPTPIDNHCFLYEGQHTGQRPRRSPVYRPSSQYIHDSRFLLPSSDKAAGHFAAFELLCPRYKY